MKLGCVVLASGEGRRFGGNKMLADVIGVPLVIRTAASVPSPFDLVVSTRWDEVARLCGEAGYACALHGGALRSESVRAGLEYGEGRGWDGCLFLPGDQPLVGAASFKALARVFAEHGGVSPVRLSGPDGAPASPVLFPGSMFGGLRSLEGKNGGSALLRGRDDVVLVPARDFELWDVDTVEALARVRERLARQEIKEQR